jgi:hypothetical protein
LLTLITKPTGSAGPVEIQHQNFLPGNPPHLQR